MRNLGTKAFAIGALIMATMSTTAQASVVRGYAHSLPPLNIDAQSSEPGITFALVQEALARADVELDTQWAPFARNVREVHNHDNGIIFPLAFSEQREPQFTWITQLIEINSIFITTEGPVNSFEEAKQLESIAVQRDSILQRVLERQGFENLVPLDDHGLAARNLLGGRVDAWYSSDLPAIHTLQTQGIERSAVVFGDSTRTVDFWLGANLAIDPTVASSISAAMDEMRADGSFDQIVAQYLN